MNYGEFSDILDGLKEHLLNTNICISNLENIISKLNRRITALKPVSKSNTCKANGRRNAR